MPVRKKVIASALQELRYMPNSPIKTAEDVGRYVDVFHADLGDLNEDLLMAAVQYHRSNKTFFPSSGDIRTAAKELQVIAMGIPVPSEAWAMVQKGMKYRPHKYCSVYIDLVGDYEKTPTPAIMKACIDHIDRCTECVPGGDYEEYDHPAVAMVVNRMGGRSAIFTDNETSDRMRFQKAYEEITTRQIAVATLPKLAGEYVETKKLEVLKQTKMLTDKLEKK